MTYAFKPAGGDWIEIVATGALLPGAGEFGEDIVMSDAFAQSLSSAARAARGFVAVVETDPPEEGVVTGSRIEDVAGVPTRAWTVAE